MTDLETTLPSTLQHRYIGQKRLGHRGGRTTILAQDRLTGRTVVLKLLRFDPEFEWDSLKLFEREAETLQTLQHPAVPRYLDCLEFEDGHRRGLALVQTYIDGLSLAQWLHQGRTFGAAEVQQLAQALLEILGYLHGRCPPVVHRDLKPSNILLRNASAHSIGEVFLVDFGAVQTLVASEGQTHTVVGTYGFMPPEQFGGRAVPASDLYSLGATLIAVVTGQNPADLPQENLRLQFSAPMLSPAFRRWLRQLTEPSLDQRFSTAEAALAALTQVDCEAKTDELGSVSGGAVARRPQDSRVSLVKTEKTLEIWVAPIGWNLGLLMLGAFAIAWNSFLVMWTGMALFIPWPFKLGVVLFSLPFWMVGVGMVGTIAFSLWGRVHLRLDDQWIERTYMLWGWRLRRPQPTPSQQIFALEHHPRSWQRDSEGSRVEVQPKLVILAGRHTYELGAEMQLMEADLDWLATELSTWLGLPIHRPVNRA
ncbi:protein kinase [Synechococcales cyanobacterium C]|uniref:Protein kinase n=1 Tax=Petrachloros mirabilis ULC683 TaxID=2781853 RepID=A0A8K2A9T8_9CYAN|nr:serine/threonine-protein kinase [Petrachloros mirabilis]NCJ08405.1 protein kinase [Petrachloros mirabilis ULC683]